MIADKNRIFDGWINIEGGVDGGKAPQMLNPNQCASAINMTFRGGDVSTRPGFRKIDESFQLLEEQQFCYINTGQYEVLDTVTIDNTDPVNTFIVSSRQNFLVLNDQVIFVTNGRLPDPLQPFVVYYAKPKETSPGVFSPTDFQVSETPGGAIVAITDVGIGTHFLIPYYFFNQNSEYIYRHGKFQCALAYSPHYGDDCIMAVIGGRLFKIVPDLKTANVTEVVCGTENPPALRNPENLPIAYMVQADKWLVVQDGTSKPMLYDGSNCRRATSVLDREKSEVPVGTIMAYGMGRICVVVNKRDVAFGDLYGSHDLPDAADSIPFFTERNFIAEGFDAAIPFQQGIATGMAFFPQLDTSTGNGQLLVFAERGAASFFLSLPREVWKTSSFQILALLTTGMRGHRAIAPVNEDLWFRADDGVRNYRQARSESTGYAHIPVSTELKQYLDNDTQWLLQYGSVIYFDNRVLATISPARNTCRLDNDDAFVFSDNRPHFNGMAVVDFDILSSFGVDSRPAWEGRWNFPNKIRVLQLLTGQFKGISRAFAFCLDENDQTQLFEISKSDVNDWDEQRIEWEFVSRAFDFSKLSQDSTPYNEVELYDADLWLTGIAE